MSTLPPFRTPLVVTAEWAIMTGPEPHENGIIVSPYVLGQLSAIRTIVENVGRRAFLQITVLVAPKSAEHDDAREEA